MLAGKRNGTLYIGVTSDLGEASVATQKRSGAEGVAGAERTTSLDSENPSELRWKSACVPVLANRAGPAAPLDSGLRLERSVEGNTKAVWRAVVSESVNRL